jgi:hypothetical protein
MVQSFRILHWDEVPGHGEGCSSSNKLRVDLEHNYYH